MKWNYKDKYVDISMPNYINNLLSELKHKVKTFPQYAPHKWTEPAFGQKRQYAKPTSDLPILDKKGIRYVQSVVGSFLYYSRAIDIIMLPAHALHVLDHPQPPTPLKTDNSTSYSFVHCNIRQKKSKSWDMRYDWLRDREVLKHLRVYWQEGIKKLADYFTKHFPPNYHRSIRGQYLLKDHLLHLLAQFQTAHARLY